MTTEPRSRGTDRLTISCDDALADATAFDAVIDVRSPSEFADDHLPDAINAPVLDDAQRAEVGTLHRHAGAFEARRHGAALVARNIAEHLEHRFADRPRDWRPLVYCWRGGQRSAAMAHVMARIGWRARQLDGGYRAFRRRVMADLDTLPATLNWVVIAGPTGSGKSRLLQQIAAAGGQALDLEQLACHRGSVLGGLPTAPQPSQRMFETTLWTSLRTFDAARPVFVESESRKVGQLRVPDALITGIRAAGCVQIELPLADRITLLREEYAHFERAPATLVDQLRCLEPLHGKARVASWIALVESGDWQALVERLLIDHYDPAYRKSLRKNFGAVRAAPVVAVTGNPVQAFGALAREWVSDPPRALRGEFGHAA